MPAVNSNSVGVGTTAVERESNSSPNTAAAWSAMTPPLNTAPFPSTTVISAAIAAAPVMTPTSPNKRASVAPECVTAVSETMTKVDAFPNPLNTRRSNVCVGELEGTSVGAALGSAEGDELGLDVGNADGFPDGAPEGEEDGIEEGISEGAEDGENVGNAVGTSVGAPVGRLVGNADGTEVGYLDGLALGAAEGAALGLAVGAADGCKLGAAVGTTEGAALGTALGAPVGAAVGFDVGAPEGSDVGSAVGRADGTDVGSTEGTPVGTPVGALEGSTVGSTEGAPVGPPEGIEVDGSREGEALGTPEGRLTDRTLTDATNDRDDPKITNELPLPKIDCCEPDTSLNPEPDRSTENNSEPALAESCGRPCDFERLPSDTTTDCPRDRDCPRSALTIESRPEILPLADADIGAED